MVGMTPYSQTLWWEFKAQSQCEVSYKFEYLGKIKKNLQLFSGVPCGFESCKNKGLKSPNTLPFNIYLLAGSLRRGIFTTQTPLKKGLKKFANAYLEIL